MERRKLWLGLMLMGMFCSSALAIAPMGPPVAGLAEGQYAVGAGVAMTDQTLEVSGPLGGLTGDGEVDVENMMYYGIVGYGISNDWNIAVALGMADAEIDADSGGSDFDGDMEFGFGLQTKRTLHDNGSDTKWGTIFQYCRGSSEDKISRDSTFGHNAIDVSAGRKVEFEWYEMQLALGPAVQVSQDVCVYGGPFLHFLEGDMEVQNSQDEYELEQRLELGGFIGALLNLGGSASVSIEFLITGEAWGAGIGAMFPL